jgi:hypothetical protein
MAQIPSGVVSAKLIDLASGEVKRLETKVKSGCHFMDRFSHGGYEIGLRVDWTKPDENDNPMLDADFFAPGGTKSIKSMRHHVAHKTAKALDPALGAWTYDFEFNGLRMRLLLAVTREARYTADCIVAMSSIKETDGRGK